MLRYNEICRANRSVRKHGAITAIRMYNCMYVTNFAVRISTYEPIEAYLRNSATRYVREEVKSLFCVKKKTKTKKKSPQCIVTRGKLWVLLYVRASSVHTTYASP